jgi:uncharacterized protein YlxW (UPF0749 family)
MFVELAASALLLVPGICYACDSLTIENSTTRTVIQRNQGCLVKENASQRQELQDLRKRLREVEKDRDDSKEREKRWQEDAEKPPVSWNAWTVRARILVIGKMPGRLGAGAAPRWIYSSSKNSWRLDHVGKAA